ncbi:9000_t:CDS:1 [Gigaspora margarita]|uniref:9000_t:CDS:1 n=1 Tax=Gigaspora margarita TaxID=4874 RepID=A0ABN7VIL9_GIGMA|nr:9000_t:CDS:1 [Gigaspora margarita]
MACKHIFAIYHKFYTSPIQYTTFISNEKKPEENYNITFNDWIKAIQKVWNRYDSKDRNKMTSADLKAIVDAGMKRKSTIDLYDECEIPTSEMKGTYYHITKQKN